jgi:hypothetical protein
MAAAVGCADAGLRVILVEPTGTLGREIVRGRAMFVDAELLKTTLIGRRMLERLIAGSAWFDGAFDTNFASLVFDEILADAGVDVLFHAWPVRAVQRTGRIQGLQFASRSGYATVSAPHVIDASRRGRLIGTASGQPIAERLVSQRYLFQLLGHGSAEDGRLSPSEPASPTNRSYDARWFDALDLDGERIAVEVRHTQWPGELRVALELRRTPTAPNASVALDRLSALTRQVEPLQGARLVHIGEEPLEFTSVAIGPEGHTVAGLSWAGPHGPAAAVKPTDEHVFGALFDSGETAALAALV